MPLTHGEYGRLSTATLSELAEPEARRAPHRYPTGVTTARSRTTAVLPTRSSARATRVSVSGHTCVPRGHLANRSGVCSSTTVTLLVPRTPRLLLICVSCKVRRRARYSPSLSVVMSPLCLEPAAATTSGGGGGGGGGEAGNGRAEARHRRTTSVSAMKNTTAETTTSVTATGDSDIVCVCVCVCVRVRASSDRLV